MKYAIELIQSDNPNLHHNCTVGRCTHRGQYRILIDYKQVQVCLPHAVKYCRRYGLQLPKENS